MSSGEHKTSFKVFARKHLAKKIADRRKSRVGRLKQKERHERRDKRKTAETKKEESEHQAQLRRLREDDPEFYSYLEEEDPTLLQYGDFGSDAEAVPSDDEMSDAETEEDDDDDAEGEGEKAVAQAVPSKSKTAKKASSAAEKQKQQSNVSSESSEKKKKTEADFFDEDEDEEDDDLLDEEDEEFDAEEDEEDEEDDELLDFGEEAEEEDDQEGGKDEMQAASAVDADSSNVRKRISKDELEQVVKGNNPVRAVDFIEAAVRQLGYRVKNVKQQQANDSDGDDDEREDDFDEDENGGRSSVAQKIGQTGVRADALRKYEDPDSVKAAIVALSNKLGGLVPAFLSVLNADGDEMLEPALTKKQKKEQKMIARRAARELMQKNKRLREQGADAQVDLLLGPQLHFKNDRSRWLVQRFLNLVLVLLDPTTGAANDGHLCARLCHALVPFICTLHLIRGLTKPLLRALFNLCAHQQVKTRVAAYLLIENLAKRAAGTRTQYQSIIFKGLFLQMVKCTHKYTIQNAEVVGFLMNAVKDLYGTDLECAYQHVYVYTRQLAIYLRSALQNQTAANIRAVFNWQYLNALRTWALVVSSFPGAAQLGPLIHPVVQIATGLLNLFGSPRMFPMHLHVLEMLNHLSQRAGVYCPVAYYILRLLNSPTISLESARQKSKPHGGSRADPESAAAEYTPLDLQFALRVKKHHAKDALYRTNVWEQAVYLLTQHLATHSHSIAFPEAFWAVSSTLSKLRREVKSPKVNALLAVLSRHHDATVQMVTAKRDQVSFGPCDVDQVDAFEADIKQRGTPLMQYYDEQRRKRIAEFQAKQKSLEPRTTLEGAIAAASRGGGSGNRRGNNNNFNKTNNNNNKRRRSE